jgi:predicted O-methyltransferase YrrM
VKRTLRSISELRVLPPRVALFQWRARRLATRAEDRFALVSGTRPGNLATLLRVARGCERIAELGTGSAWTAISLALADSRRRIISYDPIERPERERYLRLAGSARSRIALVASPGSRGPLDGDCVVDLLYIDSSHDQSETIDEVRTWRPHLYAASLIVFDDFGHPDYPGVAAAIRSLELPGEQVGSLFIHRVAEAPTAEEQPERAARSPEPLARRAARVAPGRDR